MWHLLLPFSFLYFFFNLFPNINSQTISPQYHNFSVLEEGVQIQQTISAHEVFIHQFEKADKETVKFYYHADQKRSLFFGYSASDVEKLEIKESQIPKYLTSSLFSQPSTIESYSFFTPSLSSSNKLTNKKQYVIIIYCPLDVECSYSLLFVKNTFNLRLLDNKPIMIQMKKDETISFTINTNKVTSNENVTVTVSSNILSGLVAMDNFEIEEKAAEVNRTTIGRQESVSLSIAEGTSFTFKEYAIEASFFLFKYEENIKTNSTIELGIVQSHSMLSNETEILTLSQNSFENKKIVVNIKSENCDLKITDLNITDLSSKAEHFSNSKQYYQLIFSEVNDYAIKVEIDSDDNSNNTCAYYTYATDNSSSTVTLMEGFSFTTRLSLKYPKFFYEFPYILDNTDTKDFVGIKYETDLHHQFSTAINVNGHTFKSIASMRGEHTIGISKDFLVKYCEKLKICMVKVSIITKYDDTYVDLKVIAKNNIMQYIPKNKIINDKISGNFAKIYYTYINKNDKGKGKVKVLYQNQQFTFSYLLIQSKSSLQEVLRKNWTTPEYSLYSDLTYEAGDECEESCKLFVKISISNNETVSYGLFIETNENSISGKNNERIKGNFHYDKNQYTFRYQLNNITKFQVTLGGMRVKYNFRNVDGDKVPITFNETYYPEEGSTFITPVIGDGTTRYNMTLEIIAISTNPDPYMSFFEITVIPFEYYDVPIYYLNNGETIDCYSGKDYNIIYIFYDAENIDATPYYLTFYTTFHGTRPKKFNYYRVVKKFWDAQTMDVKDYLTYYKNINFEKEYIVIDISLSSVHLIKIVTENDSKVSFTFAEQKKYYEHQLISIPQNTMQVYYFHYSIIDIATFDAKKLPSSNYTYLLELEPMQGEITLYSYTKQNIKWKKYIYYTQKQYKQLMFANENPLITSVKVLVIDKQYYGDVKIVDPTKMTNYEFYENPFPLVFAMKTQDTMSNLQLMFKLLLNPDKKYYDFKNLVIKCYFSDKESIDNYNKDRTPLKQLKEIETVPIYERPFILLEEKEKENLKKYKYLIIQVEESNETKEWKDLNIQFEITPYILYDDFKVIHLADGRYHYHRLVDSYQVYEFESRYWKIYTLFSSCSKDKYNITLKYDNGCDFKKDYVNSYDENGQQILGVSNDKWNNVILNVSLIDSVTDLHYVAIKGTKEFKMHNFVYENISIEYDPMETYVKSKWDSVKNYFNANSTFSTLYYYYLYKGDKDTEPYRSICSVMKPSYRNTIQKENAHGWTIDSNEKADYYENHIIAYFTSGDEEFLIPFIPVKVKITSKNYLAIWVSIALGVIALLIIYGTYALYKEIKQRQREIEEEEMIEELKKNE